MILALFASACLLPYKKKDSSILRAEKTGRLIVWSVGQGQMVTYVFKKTCHHFDMGGEYFPKKDLFKTCGQKKNRVYYSHWDQDHINFSLKVKKILPSLCRSGDKAPPNRKKYRKKRKIILKIPLCAEKAPDFIEEIPLKKKPKNSNESSRIFVLNKKVLIPGDSPSKMEKHWSKALKDPSFKIEVLIVGHHGSRSSTSKLLLSRIPHLKLAASSARRKRYGHPHPLTIKRLRKKRVRVLNTEDFGHIDISLHSLQAWPLGGGRFLSGGSKIE